MKKAAAVFLFMCCFISGLQTAATADETATAAQPEQTVQAAVTMQTQENANVQTPEQQLTAPASAEQTAETQPQLQQEQDKPQPAVKEEPAASTEKKEEKSKKCERIHPYIRADAGFTYSAFDIKYQDVTKELAGLQAMYNCAAGIKYKKGRFELAYQQRGTMSDFLFFLIATSAWVENDAVMANAFYDFVSSEYFALYIGGGAGVNMWNSEFKSFGDKYTDSGTSFIGGVYLGASINTPIGFSIDFGVDYFYVNEPLMNSFVPKIGARLTF